MQDQAYWIGVDLHTQVIQVCVLDQSGEICFDRRYRGPSLEEGCACVQELAQSYPGARLVVEALGSNRWFVRACRKLGLQVTVAHGSRLDLKASGRKTDRRDAYELARRHRLGDIERNALSYHPDAVEYGWRQLTRRRHALIEQRTEQVSMIRAMLRSHRIQAPAGKLYGVPARKKLEEIRLENEDEQAVLEGLLLALNGMVAAIGRLEQRILELWKQDTRMAQMRDIPQVGPITTVSMIAELGDVKRFRRAKAVASYVGIVPRVQSSGGREHHGRIVKHGNRELRYVLGEWAVRLLSKDERVKAWSRSMLARMPKNKVRVALARKLLIGVWHVLRTGEVFSLERCLATA